MPVAILGTQITLWCFDLQSSSKFKILIGADNDIDDLKEVIKEKCGFASPLFKLWRVNTNRVVEEMLNDELVDTAQTIGETFYGVEGGNIRVAVNAPEQPGASGLSREPTGLVHVFIDNSNVEIEGKKFVSSLQAVCENQLHMDHGRLLGLVLDGRQLGEDPVVVGSRPPPNDSLWKEIENLGFMVKVYDRNCRDKEKEVDSELGAFISDAIQEHRRPGIVALIAGDGDHCPFLRRALLRGWSVEVWFWTEGMSSRLMKINVPDRPDLQTTIINLDPYYSHFIYAYGRENTWRKEFLEIEDSVGTWDSESMMECYEELNLFCWWSYKPRNTFYMYFDEYEQWKEAKNWILEKYSDITEYRKEMAQLNPRQMPCQIVLQIDKR